MSDTLLTCLYKKFSDQTYCGKQATAFVKQGEIGQAPVCPEHAELFRETTNAKVTDIK